jgi:hypothetical protein
MTALDFIKILLVCGSPFILAFTFIYTAEAIDKLYCYLTGR